MLAVCLSLVCALLAFSGAAFADDLDDVKAELNAKASELQEITDRVNASGEDVAVLEEEIESLVAVIEEGQERRGELQRNIAALAKLMYKNGDQLNVLTIFTNSESFSDVMQQMEVRRKVLEEYGQLVEEQDRVSSELQVSYQRVSTQKDEQVQKLAELREQQAALDGAVGALQARADELTEAQRRALEEAAEAERRAEEAAAAAALEEAQKAAEEAEREKQAEEQAKQ
ncbi:MAG: hypothetical protein Q3963_03370, partial [Coriobacteriaceae bacterium]|nr:hypothetical protein [Coriobacteriaceae bacterium]